MRAVIMTAEGGPEVFQWTEIAEPEIATPTQIKVRLRAAGVNPVDTKLRARGVFFPDALPAILGCDGAGEVVECGDQVSRFRPGDAVWFCHGGLGREPGNYAEYTVLDEALAQPKPESLSFAEAAAAPLVLITAWEALFDRAKFHLGQWVLIHAGGGGVGHVAIQLAKIAGGRVCTTVGSERNAELVRELGADQVINYHDEDFLAAVNRLTGGVGADVVLDTVGPEVFRRSIEATADYGDLVTLLDPGPEIQWKEARNRNLRIGFVLMLTPMLKGVSGALAHHGDILQRCGRWCDEGRLKVHIDRRFPMAAAAEAHAYLAQGHASGKVVLEI